MNLNIYPKLSELQILPPFGDENKFEEFVMHCFNNLEDTTTYDLFGRRGQKQYGLDIFSVEKNTVIQCKLKDAVSRNNRVIVNDLKKDLESDFNKFIKFNEDSGHKFNRFIFASTWKNDTEISTICIKLSTKDLKVEYWSWDRLLRNTNDEVAKKFYSDFYFETKEYYFENQIFEDKDSSSEIIEKQLTNYESKITGLTKYQNNSLIIEENSDNARSENKGLIKNKVFNKRLHIVYELYNIISIKFDGLATIPIHLLKSQYPFKVEKSLLANYNIFTLTTDNKELFDFFKSVKIEENGRIAFTNLELVKGVSNYEEKTKSILKKLTNSLIFKIAYKSEELNIYYSTYDDYNCASCQFHRFEFNKAFKKLTKETTSVKDIFEHAYLQYEIGNYLEASKSFMILSKEAKENKQIITYFIAEYNLTQLKRFVEFSYYGKATLFEEYKLIDLDETYNQIVSEEKGNEELLKWIKDNSFLRVSSTKIRKHVSDIQDHYYSHLKGNWSSNRYVWELINEFAKLDGFVHGNNIINNKYTDFLEVADLFIEGMFASHAIKGKENRRLLKFDDWMLEKIVSYGDVNKIFKHFNRYKLKELIYVQSAKNGTSFVDLMHNLLTVNKNIVGSFNKYCETNNRDFWHRYNNLFSNMLTVASLINLKKSQVNVIAENLLIFIENDKSIFSHSIKFIRIFLTEKGKLIKKTTLKKFLLLSLKVEKLQRDDYVEQIIKQIKKHNGKLILSERDYYSFEKLAFNNNENNQITPSILSCFFELLKNAKLKQQIQSRINTSLDQEFNHELYYNSVINEAIVINPKDKLIRKFIDASIPPAKRTSFKSAFTGVPDIIYPKLNALINVCYKCEINLSDKMFDKLRGLSNYFDWLLDMDGFDYDMFEPKWINEYLTKYYSEEIRKHQVIYDRICEYLKEKKDPRLEENLVKIFCLNE